MYRSRVRRYFISSSWKSDRVVASAKYRGACGEDYPGACALAGPGSPDRTDPRALASCNAESARPDPGLLAGYRVVRCRLYPRGELGAALPRVARLDERPCVRHVRTGPERNAAGDHRLD